MRPKYARYVLKKCGHQSFCHVDTISMQNALALGF